MISQLLCQQRLILIRRNSEKLISRAVLTLLPGREGSCPWGRDFAPPLLPSLSPRPTLDWDSAVLATLCLRPLLWNPQFPPAVSSFSAGGPSEIICGGVPDCGECFRIWNLKFRFAICKLKFQILYSRFQFCRGASEIAGGVLWKDWVEEKKPRRKISPQSD